MPWTVLELVLNWKNKFIAEQVFTCLIAIPLQSLQVLQCIILDGSASGLIMKTSTEDCIYKIYMDLANRKKTW